VAEAARGSPTTNPIERTLYQVRVPVIFDHLNEDLRQQLVDREVQFKQHLGRGVEVVSEHGYEVGKFEVWFEVNREPSTEGRQDAADSAIELVEEALKRVDLATTDDERGLSVVHTQVITTRLAN
jgi:hypothetical protein